MARRASDQTPKRIEAVLKQHFPADTIVDVSPSGIRNNLHVLVVSRTLDTMSEKQKQEHLWGLLEDGVRKKKLKNEELNRISVVLPLSVEELRR